MMIILVSYHKHLRWVLCLSVFADYSCYLLWQWATENLSVYFGGIFFFWRNHTKILFWHRIRCSDYVN